MGSARVQYELERTLPSLQLAATHGLFSKDVELRAITQRRRQYENALVRRQALARDYIQYIHYEEDLEKLRVLRVTRLKEINRIPRQDMIKMQKEAISHIVSIFERGVKRLRYDLNLWQYYIRWAHKRKMRVVVSRVSARALALFPNKVDLWLLVASHELNDYQGASTSRALLQRGLRLNSISHPRSNQVQAQQRPQKKAKRGQAEYDGSTTSLEITSAGNAEEDQVTLTLTESEQDLVRIWTQYIRMELVFIERLRRRRVVLGISEDNKLVREEGTSEAEDDTGADQVPINNEGEAAPTSIKSMKQSIEVDESSDGLLQGAIPKAALRSAISLQSPSSLPPRAHFALLLAITKLIQSFPFYEDKDKIRAGLLSNIEQIVHARFCSDPSAILLVSAFSLLNRTQTSTLASLSDIELKEELQDGQMLKSASILTAESSTSTVEEIFEEVRLISRAGVANEDLTSISFSYILQMIRESFDQIEQTAQVASDMRSIIESMREKTLKLEEPMGIHLAFQMQLISFFEKMAERKKIRSALDQYLKACYKRVTQDAKMLRCDGLDLGREQCKGKLRDVIEIGKGEETKTKTIKIVDSMWETCEMYPTDKSLLLLYAKAVVECYNSGVFDEEAIRKQWLRIQSHDAGKGSAAVWMIWRDWVLATQDNRSISSQLESSLSKTMNAPEAHEVLLQGYLMSSHSSQGLEDRITYIEKKAYPQATLWRWAIEHTKGKSLSDEEKLTLVKRIYLILIQTTNNINVEDYCAYLRYLMLDANEPAIGLQVFKEAQSRLSREVSKKVTLEGEWEVICQSMRNREDENQSQSEEETALNVS